MKLQNIPTPFIGGSIGLVIGALLNVLAFGLSWWAALANAALGAAVAAVWLWFRQRRRVRRANRDSYNCASCGEHFPTPAITVTLGGEFQKHAGVVVIWCRDCAPQDALHAVLLRHVHAADGAAVVRTLDAMAERGPGRVTWLSQATLDRIRELGKMSVQPITDHRTVH